MPGFSLLENPHLIHKAVWGHVQSILDYELMLLLCQILYNLVIVFVVVLLMQIAAILESTCKYLKLVSIKSAFATAHAFG